MADRIGVSRKWLQHPNTTKEHFDISQSKRRLAVRAGAREVSRREIGNMILARIAPNARSRT